MSDQKETGSEGRTDLPKVQGTRMKGSAEIPVSVPLYPHPPRSFLLATVCLHYRATGVWLEVEVRLLCQAGEQDWGSIAILSV